MALTDFCDIFSSVNESAFNQVVLQLQRQRPSLFNYGTTTFVHNPRYLCNQTIIHMLDPEVSLYGNPVVHELPLLGIPGDSSGFGLEYCLQISELTIDFNPSNTIALPAELNPPLPAQHFALKGRVCGGIACPSTKVLVQVASNGKPQETPSRSGKDDRGPLVTTTPSHPFPFSKENVLCFCLDLYGVFHVEREGVAPNVIIELKLDAIDIVEIKPDGLEQSLLCFLRAFLILSVLPKIQIALKSLTFNIANILTIGPTPISANVPFNPAIENDQIKVFITVS